MMQLGARIVRYGVVGTSVSVLYSLAIVFFMDALHVGSPTLASVLAFAVTLPISYLAHRNVTFRDAARHRSQPWRFAATTVLGFIVTTIGMYGLTAGLRLPYYYGIALAWALIPATNFSIYLVWVFRPGRIPGGASLAAFPNDIEIAEHER